ncbi:hypothetical protein B296_00049446, partial [Ensete ventricosum]
SDTNFLNRSAIFEASNNKNTQGTLAVSRTSRTGSTKPDTGSTSPMAKQPSPMSKPRVSVDRSPRSAESKTANKNSTTPDKLPRAAKASELREKLHAVEKDLKKARDQLASVELEKIKAVEELNEAKHQLQQATEAQGRAEESLDMEKLRASELQKSGKDASLKREEGLQREIEGLRSRQTRDASAMSSMAQELERIKAELVDATNARELALTQADDAKRTAELLSQEVGRLKASHDSKLDDANKEATEMIQKMDAEVSAMQLELGRAKAAEEKLAQMEALIEKLQIEVADARKGKSDASELVDEWRKKTEMLKADLEEAYQSEKSASDSLAAMMVQLEESKSLFEDAESEISTLRGKIKSLEIEVAKQKTDLEESDRQLDSAQQDAVNIGKTVDLLKLELQTLEEEKLQAVNREKVAAAKAESLTEENDRLINELKISKDEGEKGSKAMEGLASALQAISREARDKEERLLRTEAEVEEAQAEIEQLNIALRNTEERYEVMLDEARYDIVCLKKIVERFEAEGSKSSSEWAAKELNFVNTIKELEEEIAAMKIEMARMVELQKAAEQATQEAKKDSAETMTKLRQAETGATCAYGGAAEESKHERLRLREALLDKETELQSIAQENDDLRGQEAAALQKASVLLTQATAKKMEDQQHLKGIEEADVASERDHEEESFDDDDDDDEDMGSNTDGSSINLTDGTNGSTDDGTASSPAKQLQQQQQQQQQQRKKALLHKFGNLLKNKNF